MYPQVRATLQILFDHGFAQQGGGLKSTLVPKKIVTPVLLLF
jgi:hypothetical protein